MRIAWLIVVTVLAWPGAGAAQDAASGPSLDEVIDGLTTAAPGENAGSVRLDAWVEDRADGAREVVVVVEPEGRTKLIADPGITITPQARSGIDWRLPLPHRHVDTAQEYFDPPAAVRLPFDASDGRPIEITVEYAYCVVDHQCFFGEEDLTVANRIE